MSKIRVEQPYIAKYGPIVMWWDDLTYIVELLQASGSGVEIETHQYKFTTLEVAKEHFGTETQFDIEIKASTPYFKFNDNRLYISPGDTSAKLFMEINSILKKRERKPKILYSNYLGVIIVGIGLLSFSIKYEPAQAILLGIQSIFCLLLLRAMYINLKRSVVVYTHRKSEAKGFFERNKDQLLMMIITTIVGGLIGFGISQMKDKYFPPTTQSKPG